MGLRFLKPLGLILAIFFWQQFCLGEKEYTGYIIWDLLDLSLVGQQCWPSSMMLELQKNGFCCACIDCAMWCFCAAVLLSSLCFSCWKDVSCRHRGVHTVTSHDVRAATYLCSHHNPSSSAMCIYL